LRGANPSVCVVAGLLIANAWWFFYVKGTSIDVRWIFYFLGVNPKNAQVPLPPAVISPPESVLRFPIMIVFFFEITPDFWGGLCLFMVILSIYATNYIFIALSGTYLYLEKYIEGAEEAVIDCSAHKKLRDLSYADNIGWPIGITIMVIAFAILFVLLSLRLITLKSVISLFCFIVWVYVILSVIFLARRFVLNSLCFYTSTGLMDNMDHYDEHAKKELKKIILSQRKAIKLCTIGLFFVYIVTGILTYNYCTQVL
jgi:hypothetical protein